ncbi:MAG: homocitrate synthase family protein [Candidatus Methanomethylicia archaeon]
MFNYEVNSINRDVLVFDTTLRDGEQTPGVCFSVDDKLKIARLLDDLGVNVIEAGFPASWRDEEEATRLIAGEGLKAEVCGLARCESRDIDVCLRCDVDRIHVFIGTSDIHLKYKLKIDEGKALENVVEAIEYVKAHGLKCEFSCEDATRTSFSRLLKFYSSASDAHVDIVNIPDTVGVFTPELMFKLISNLKRHVNTPISVHCHNDFGLATANTIAGVLGGASQIHVTINGLGERAGNASLEQTVCILKFIYGFNVNLRFEKIAEISRIVQDISGIKIPPNYPLVGRNAFAHESGIHVHGVLENPLCYEPLKPETIGQKRHIFFGKHSGRHGVEHFIKARYGNVSKSTIDEVLRAVKALGVNRKALFEEDLDNIFKEIVGGGNV